MRGKNDDFLYVLSLCPWWVSATIALAGYIVIVHVLPTLSIDLPVFGPIIQQSLQSYSNLFGIIFATLFLVPAGTCIFQPKPITDSGASRSPIPSEADHRFRPKPITFRPLPESGLSAEGDPANAG